MNEELNSALIELIGSATSVKDFIVTESLDVIQQLLVWNFAASFSALLCSQDAGDG